jgi:deoxyadenosine/deoxycytidine kinase
MHIKVVGPCAAGKSTLTDGLQRLGYDASSAAQDHSYVPDMWQRVNPPDVLIYLDVTLEEAHRRGRCGSGWDQAYLDEEHGRLRHARAHCNFYLATDGLSVAEVRNRVVDFLQQMEGSPLDQSPGEG